MINYARDKVSHSDEPVFLDDDRGGGTGCGDRTGGNVPLSRLQDRLDATVAKYPRLGECYEGVPVFLGLGRGAWLVLRRHSVADHTDRRGGVGRHRRVPSGRVEEGGECRSGRGWLEE